MLGVREIRKREGVIGGERNLKRERGAGAQNFC
jgi:hypothetical protein